MFREEKDLAAHLCMEEEEVALAGEESVGQSVG